jgi:signal transduction histidine kinase
MDWPRLARIADAAVVAALTVWAQVEVWTADTGDLVGDRTVTAVLAAAATVPLFVRRYRPLSVLLLVFAAGWVHGALGGTSGILWFSVCLGLYALGAHAERWAIAVGAAVVAAGVLYVDVPRLAAGDPVDEVLPAWFILAGLVGLGRWMRHRRHETDELHTRAEIAEREGAEQAARAVADERARIARELHDLVAHSMGMIVIQSQAAQRSLDARPDLAQQALTSIETAGRQGMAEMRRLLGLLTGSGDSAVTPQPSLRGLDDLVESVRAAGVPVELRVDGDVTTLPAGVDLSAYRIVQEALTNVLKHAGPASVTVCVRVGHGSVDVDVCDDGRGAVAVGARGGHGLVGMRERVALYGGSVEAGERSGGGYRVHARLAVDGTPA